MLDQMIDKHIAVWSRSVGPGSNLYSGSNDLWGDSDNHIDAEPDVDICLACNANIYPIRTHHRVSDKLCLVYRRFGWRFCYITANSCMWRKTLRCAGVRRLSVLKPMSAGWCLLTLKHDQDSNHDYTFRLLARLGDATLRNEIRRFHVICAK